MADYTSHVRYGSATAANAKIIALNPAPTSLVEGFALSFKNVTQNTGAVTLNVNGLGAKSVLKANGTALASGNLKANSIYTVRFNGTSFILQGEGGEYGTAMAADVLLGKTFGTEGGVLPGALTISSLGGRKSAEGAFELGGRETRTIGNLAFTPSLVFLYHKPKNYNNKYVSAIITTADGSQLIIRAGDVSVQDIINNSFVINASNGFTNETQWFAFE